MGINPYSTQRIVIGYMAAEWPLMLPADAKPGRKPRKAKDLLGDCQCPFCDEILAYEDQEVVIGKKCKGCNARVVSFTKVD